MCIYVFRSNRANQLKCGKETYLILNSSDILIYDIWCFFIKATKSCHFCITLSTCTSQYVLLLWVKSALRPSSYEVNASICLYCQAPKPKYWRSLVWLYPSAFCDLINTFPELTYLLRACTCAKCLFISTLHPASCSERSLLAVILGKLAPFTLVELLISCHNFHPRKTHTKPSTYAGQQ